ncbi:MAG TPA: hypothetical protein PKC18_16015 [Lacipirellulaceae bacterium]|nr:hypothetical protein [Lacipirellulaceae bacterium]
MSLSAKLLVELRAASGQRHQCLALVDGVRTVRCNADECQPLAATILDLAL